MMETKTKKKSKAQATPMPLAAARSLTTPMPLAKLTPLAILMSLAMAFAMMQLMGSHVYAAGHDRSQSLSETGEAETEAYDLWLGKTQVTSENHTNILREIDDKTGKPTASYDPDTGVLELHDPEITEAHPDQRSLIYLNEMQLKIKGTWKATTVNGPSYGIVMEYSTLEFIEDMKTKTEISIDITKGEGGAVIEAWYSDQQLTFSGGDINLKHSNGIAISLWYGSKMTFNGGRLQAATRNNPAVSFQEEADLTLGKGCVISKPVDWKNNGTEICDGDGNQAEEVIFELPKYDLFVGGIQVDAANMDDVLGDGKVKFTPANGYDSAVLTLNNAKIDVAEINDADAGGIYVGSGGNGEYVGSLVIDLKGENLIKTPDHDIASDRINGIVAYGIPRGYAGLTIAGEGSNGDSLKMEISADGDRHAQGVSCTDIPWLYVYSDLSMDVLATGNGKNSYGIHTYGNLDVKPSDESKVDMDISGYNAVGILCEGGIELDSPLTIDLNMKKEDCYSTGIQGDKDSKLDINGGAVRIRSGEGNCNYGIAQKSVNLTKGSLIIDMGAATNESYGLYSLKNNTGYNLDHGLNASSDYLEKGGYVEITGRKGVIDRSSSIDPDLYKKGAIVNEDPKKEGAHEMSETADIHDYKYFRVPETVYSLTAYWSSIDGVDIDGQKPLIIKDIPAGMTIGDAFAKEGMDYRKMVYKNGIFKKDGYIQYGAMSVPVTDYKNWNELWADSESISVAPDEVISGNTDIYIYMMKAVNSASITVEPPVCGEKTDTEKKEDDSDEWDLMTQTNTPKYSFPEDADYGEFVFSDELRIPKSFWGIGEGSGILPYKGKFEGGKKYDFGVLTMPKYGYLFSEDATYSVNGQKTEKVVTVDGVFTMVLSDIEAVHTWDSGKITKAATTTEAGTKTYTCTACKATRTETIPKLAKKANPLKVKGLAATVKYSKLKKKAQSIKRTKAIKVTGAQGKLTYKKSSVTYSKAKSVKMSKKALKKYKKKSAKKILINAKTGKITLKKGLKKGTYKLKIKVKAAGNANYDPSAWKTVTVTLKVK